jgi:cell cycle sensor histidine kinase DivJ
MRSLPALGKRPDAAGDGRPGRRVEKLLRAALTWNARLVLAVAALLMPGALFALIHGAPIPLMLAGLGLATGAATWHWAAHGLAERASLGQVYAILGAGALLTLLDPALVDFGLALVLLAPVLASLVAGRADRRRAWVLAVVALAGGLVLSMLHLPAASAPGLLRVPGGIAFFVAALAIAHTSNRLNSAFEVFERGQLNAYRHLVEHLQDGVLRFARDGELLFSSTAIETLLGCRRYELAGSGLIDRIHVLDRPVYMTAFADANRAGRARKIEIRIRRDTTAGAAPRFVWIEMGLSPVVDGEGGRYEVVALLRDITDRRDQEHAMQAARKAAETASEAKSRFLATIGHELRTPLNAIIGFSEMMTSNIGGELSPMHREYAGLIHNSGTHLIGIVGMLLDMSRLEAGKFELHTESFSPEALLDPCLSMIAPLAQAKDLTVRPDLQRGLPTIVADERACRQILINLLSNAVKFSHEGGTIDVTMKRQGGWLNISVTDRGIGMAPEAVARVGEPFFQAHDGLARRYEGTGLGLSIVKGLIDLHQGALRVASEAGNGTTMTVLLPINGPETKMPESERVAPLRPEVEVPAVADPWPEQRRSAK